jgi:hypothetical protein
MAAPATAPASTSRWAEYDGWYDIAIDPAELPADTETAAREAGNTILSYLEKLNPIPSDMQVYACQWPPEYDGLTSKQPDHGWAVRIKVTVRAVVLDPAITSNDTLWPVSAHGVIDAGSWGSGSERGWELGCAHHLTVVPAGQEPQLTLQPVPR